jgi:hypothetical protein
MHTYRAFGLAVASELPLAELVPEDGAVEPDVHVRFGTVERLPSNIDERAHRATPEEVTFHYDSTARIRVRGGEEIVVDPVPGGDESFLRACLVGPVLAALLHQRGLLVLHASAVAIDGTASLFLGEKGWGKSTTAAFLQARGHAFLADDVVAIDTRDAAEPRVVPGFPQLKLWPSSVAHLGVDPESLPRVQADLEKRGLRLGGPFAARAVEVGRIYLLDVGERCVIEPLAPRDAVLGLVENTYLLRYLDATGTRVRNLTQCARLASAVPVRTLVRRPSLDLLSEVAELLEQDARDVATVAI